MRDLIERVAAIDALDVGAELLRRVLDDADIVGAEREKYEWGLGMKRRRKHPESVIRQRPGTCFLCERLEDDIGTKAYLETHHIIFGTANRIKSEEEGLTVRLCLRHHRIVHRDSELSKKLQAYAQRKWEAMPGHTRVEWMRIFHRNYL